LIDLRRDIEAWCASYVKAFSSYDPQAIAAHWTFPALILSSGRSIGFKSAEQFTKNTDALLGFYKVHKVDRALRSLVDCMLLNEETVSITVDDQMVEADGSVIVSWQAAYVLQRLDGEWRAVCALADGELAAWAERGTPLGGGQ